MESYLLDWANLLIRWLHLITGIAWIGGSFYFVMLDLSLRKPKSSLDSDRGVSGELWAVHGGGVYHSEKFLSGPKKEPLSEHLHWSKWEAYTTWMSGIGMMTVVYWLGASSYLIDKTVMELTVTQAVTISVMSLAVSWVVYDVLCRLLGKHENLLAAILLAYIVFCGYLLFHVFSARAAYLHVGALMGTIMAANVFFHIIPGQKKMVAEIRQGLTPNPIYGIIGKQRSVHNTYFTLPVLFLMISNHYPMTYSHKYGWLVMAIILLAGVLIRQFFVLRHSGRGNVLLPLIAIALIAAVVVWLKPVAPDLSMTGKVSYSEVKTIFQNRCQPCHSQTPTQPGFAQPPKGVMLQTDEQIEQHKLKIQETVGNRYMPIANLTGMTDDERAKIAAWFAAGASQAD